MNELQGIVTEGLDHGLEVAAVIEDAAGRFVVVFRPRMLPSLGHVTATIVDRNGYPR